MPASIHLPPSTTILATAITNAGNLQRVTLTPPASMGPPIVWQGSGENNTQIGQTNLVTPEGTQHVSVAVTIENSSDGGRTWSQSSLIRGSCSVATMCVDLLLSEDSADNDYNDAVVQFLWWKPLN